MDEPDLPTTLTIDEGFRAAFYMVLQYLEIEKDVNDEVLLYAEYLWSDPARRDDWETAIRRALADGGLADPDCEAPERRWPGLPGTPMAQSD
jgi:hypothetical protein